VPTSEKETSREADYGIYAIRLTIGHGNVIETHEHKGDFREW